MAETITRDYLVIGAGAMGMAFVDALLASSPDKTFAIVDRCALPGGHWTVSCPYVKLHQPSTIYGVNSRSLGEDKIDQVGWNKGLLELAGQSEILAYYDKVLRQTFLPSDRVAYYPKHEYTGGREARSILTHKVVQVGDKTKIVDATYMKVTVPSMGPPAYKVAKDVQLICLNDLPSMTRPYGNFAVIDAGKTDIDAILWLLTNDVDPARMSWIMPRDSYFFQRENLQPRPSPVASQSKAAGEAMNSAIIQATSMDDLIKRWVDCEQFLQLDPSVKPEMFRCATVSKPEFQQLRNITNIIRQGRVVRISQDEVVLKDGTYKFDPDTLFIDCTADGLTKRR